MNCHLSHVAWTKLIAVCILALAAGQAAGQDNLIPNPQFALSPDRQTAVGWKVWSPRSELMPSVKVEGDTLELHATRFEEYGAWRTNVQPVEPGKYYRFQVLHRAQNVKSEDVSVAVILTWWKSQEGRGDLQRDYVSRLQMGAIRRGGLPRRER